MLKAKIGWKLRLLCQTVNQAVDAKEKFLKKIKSATLVDTSMVRNKTAYCCYEKFLVVCTDKKTSHNIPWSQSWIQSKVLTYFKSMKAERSEETAEESWKLSKLVHEA